MPELETLHVEIAVVTPDEAKRLIEECAYERQRAPNDGHIARLAREMEKGRFIPGTLVHLAMVGGTRYIVNGQHTLHAIVLSGTALPLTVLTTRCRDMKEVGQIYARHDAGRARDWAAALRATGTYDAVGLDATMANAFAAAMKTVLLGFKGHGGAGNPVDTTEINHSRDLRIAAMLGYKRYAVLYAKCVAQADRRHQARLRRAAVMAVALETFKHQPRAAQEFWQGVAKDDGLKRDDPRKAFIRYLVEHTDSRNKERYKGPRAAAAAWNAFRAGATLAKLQVPANFVLDGTPWGRPASVPRADRRGRREVALAAAGG